jgi:hypothetical protein
MLPLSEGEWVHVACHYFHYSKPEGLACRTLQQYLRMLVHVLIHVGCYDVRAIDPLHGQQFEIIERVVRCIGEAYPISRAVRNTKSAWDWRIVDAGLQLLLMWDIYGHCNLQDPAWPAFARLVLCLFNYLGWRPVSFTHAPGEYLTSLRWALQAVLSFGECVLHWGEDGRPVAVQITMLRTKFRRSPMYEACLDTGALKNRRIGVGKLTYSDQVDTCPVLAWLVWAIINGVFGYAPWFGAFGGGRPGHDEGLSCAADMTAEDVDRLVDSIFAGMPNKVPEQQQGTALLSGRMLSGGKFSVTTVQMSRVCTQVGMALGLNPRMCSAISGRKTVGTAVTNHESATQMDAAACMGHAQPMVTTLGAYADAMRHCNDTTSLVRGLPIRPLPGSVQLSHNCNLFPNTFAAAKAASAARQRTALLYARRRHSVPASKARVFAQCAYNKAFKADMQRQFDPHEKLPKGGVTNALLAHCFFQPYDCSPLTPAMFVRWQVKKALKLL